MPLKPREDNVSKNLAYGIAQGSPLGSIVMERHDIRSLLDQWSATKVSSGVQGRGQW